MDKVKMEQAYSRPLLIIISLHTDLLLSPDMCYDLYQTAYYHRHCLLVSSFMSGPALGWSQTKKFYIYIYIYIYIYVCVCVCVKTKKVHSLCLLTKFSVTFKPSIWMDVVSYETRTCETVMPFIQDWTNDHNLPICWFTQLHYSAQHVIPYHKYIKLSYERLMSAGFQHSNQNKCYCNKENRNANKAELQLHNPSGNGQVAGTCKCSNEPSGSIKCGEFLD